MKAKSLHIRVLKGHTKQVNSLDTHIEGNCLASGSDDQTIKIWDLTTYTLVDTLTVFNAPVVHVAFNNLGKINNFS